MKYHKTYFRPAFTMLELTIVIVVVGILAALAIPRMERDLRQEAADDILSAIRYTQHLALIDDKHDVTDPKWQQGFWRIYFGTCEHRLFFAIGSDISHDGANNGQVDFTESALDPANGKRLWAHSGATCEGSHDSEDISPNIFVGKKYGITALSKGGGCRNAYIGFDHLGRPYNRGFGTSAQPDDTGVMRQQCRYTFTLSNGTNFTINIEPETGYAYIADQPGS